jgi:hypothetical protein
MDERSEVGIEGMEKFPDEKQLVDLALGLDRKL